MTAPEPYYDDGQVRLHLGDCLEVLAGIPDDSVDAVVTDPPAAVSFMGREWDSDRGGRDKWVGWLAERMTEACRVLKPGGHALVWSLPRTSHWTAWALEDAGFEIRDCILHLFGSGFAKSLDVGKAIDKAAGAQREVIAEGKPLKRMIPGADQNRIGSWIKDDGREFVPTSTAPATEDAARWEGWGTALKPGQEMWWLVRKPLAAGTVAGNVLRYGTGALNIAACRVATSAADAKAMERANTPGSGRMKAGGSPIGTFERSSPTGAMDTTAGRWPPNIVLTHSAACEPIGLREVRSDGHHPASRGVGGLGTSGHGGQEGLAERKSGTERAEAWSCAADCPVAELDRQSAGTRAAKPSKTGNAGRTAESGVYGGGGGLPRDYAAISRDDAGGASRFYPTFRYQAKAPASERPRLEDGTAHETVKSLGLTSWLVKLVTPPGGTVLDMFAGSGPVGEVCVIEGFNCVLIEQNPKSAELIKTRLSKPIQPVMFGMEAS